MNPIVNMMARGVRGYFSKAEFYAFRREADTLYRHFTEENRDNPKALKQHIETNIFPAIAVYKTLLKHGIEQEAACDQKISC